MSVSTGGTTRELTPEEIAEGQRGITDRVLTATEVQALVRNMDVSKQKYRHLKFNKQAYEETLKNENEILYFNYPSLFQMHAEDRLDATFFEMLFLKRKIEKGEMTVKEAENIIGKKLFNRFTPESVRETPSEQTARPMTYEEYYRPQGQ
jgi:hypothetical protein